MKRYLFVCKANRFRSPFAAKWFDDYCRANRIEADVKSAGYKADRYLPITNTVQLTAEMLDWADRILAMESYMIDWIERTYPERRVREKSASLDVPDKFIHIAKTDAADLLTTDEALEYAMRVHRFGPKVFAKILEAKLPIILGEQ